MKMFRIAFLSVVFAGFACWGQVRRLTDFDFPDPTVWTAVDGRHYAVASGLDRTLVSDDFFTWRDAGFKIVDDETRRELESLSIGEKDFAKAHGLWAPDVAKVGEKWILALALYKSAQDSRIVSLVADAPEGPFRDPRTLTWSVETKIADTIDPEVVCADGRVFLFFGSLGGIHLLELTPDARAPRTNAPPLRIAGIDGGYHLEHVRKDRLRHFEGAYLHRRNGYWYLFASAGVFNDHTYRIVVGRSRSLSGPYLSRSGLDMRDGASTVVFATGKGERFFGPGHNGEIFSKDGRDYLYYHVHDRDLPGCGSYVPRPFAMSEIRWTDDGWPFLPGVYPFLDRQNASHPDE